MIGWRAVLSDQFKEAENYSVGPLLLHLSLSLSLSLARRFGFHNQSFLFQNSTSPILLSLSSFTSSRSRILWLPSKHFGTVQLVLKQLTFGDLLLTGDLSQLGWLTSINLQKWSPATWQEQCVYIQHCSWDLHGWYSHATIYFLHVMLQMRLFSSINILDGQGQKVISRGRRRKKLHQSECIDLNRLCLNFTMYEW